MDIFGIKKRKIRKEKKSLTRKEKKVEILKLAKEDYKRLKEKALVISRESNTFWEARDKNSNSTCPSCQSKNVNDRIKRTQGEFSGSASGSMGGFGILGTGVMAGSYNSNSKGSIDTNEVNKCNDCSHEWKKSKMASSYGKYSDKVLDDIFDDVNDILEGHKKALIAKIDLNDLAEKFDTDEEKRDDILNNLKVKKLRAKDFFEGTAITSLKEIMIKEIWTYYSDSRHIEKFNENYNESILVELGFIDKYGKIST